MARKPRPRKGRVHPAPERSERLYLEIAPGKVALFRFYLEARDNLALFTAVDRRRAVLLLRFSPHQADEVRRFLEDVSPELGLRLLPVGDRAPA